MRIVLVGNQTSVHIERWSTGLRERGHVVIPIDLRSENRGPARRVRDMVSIRRRIRDEIKQPGSVLAIHYVPNGLLATGLRGLHPLVVSIWGSDATIEPSGSLARLRDWQRATLVRGADIRTVTSGYLAKVVRRRFGADSLVVPFGVDLARFRPGGQTPGNGALRVGFVKWLEPKYGPDVLVEAIAQLDLPQPVHATVVGDGRLGAMLRQRVVELGIHGIVQFEGRVPHATIPRLLQSLDVLVMPSRSEEFGVSAAEASAAGLPVVSTNVGGVPEVVQHGVTGLLVRPDDPSALAAAITRLATDPGLRRRMGTAGRARIEALYGWDRCVTLMEAALQRAIASSRRGHRKAAAASVPEVEA